LPAPFLFQVLLKRSVNHVLQCLPIFDSANLRPFQERFRYSQRCFDDPIRVRLLFPHGAYSPVGSSNALRIPLRRFAVKRAPLFYLLFDSQSGKQQLSSDAPREGKFARMTVQVIAADPQTARRFCYI
jgi:hypothetical protein